MWPSYFVNFHRKRLMGYRSAGFTYRLDRLKASASNFRGPPTKVYNIFNTVIGLSHLCCHNVLCFLNNPTAIFLIHVALHFRILHNFNTPSISSPLFRLIKHTGQHHLPSVVKVENGEGPHMWNSLGPLFI